MSDHDAKFGGLLSLMRGPFHSVRILNLLVRRALRASGESLVEMRLC
jgi:hypothetical protein